MELELVVGLVPGCNLKINKFLAGALDLLGLWTAPLKLGLVPVCLDLYLGNLNINTLLVGALDCSFEAWTCRCMPGLVPGQS